MHQSGASAKKNLKIIVGRIVLKPKLFTDEKMIKIKMNLVLIARMQMKVVNLNKNQMIMLD